MTSSSTNIWTRSAGMASLRSSSSTSVSNILVTSNFKTFKNTIKFHHRLHRIPLPPPRRPAPQSQRGQTSLQNPPQSGPYGPRQTTPVPQTPANRARPVPRAHHRPHTSLRAAPGPSGCEIQLPLCRM